MDLNMIITEARFFATPLAKQIAERANGHYQGPAVGAFAGTCASLVTQTTIVSMLVTKYAPGSPEGEQALREFYGQAMLDAVERWHKSDLKERGLGPKGNG